MLRVEHSYVLFFFCIRWATWCTSFYCCEFPLQHSNYHFDSIATRACACRARLVLLLTDYLQLNLDVICRFVAPDMWVPHFVIDLIWGWLISCLSTTISVQGCDLRLLASNARAGVRSGMMKGSVRRSPVDTADWWTLFAYIAPCRRACVALPPLHSVIFVTQSQTWGQRVVRKQPDLVSQPAEFWLMWQWSSVKSVWALTVGFFCTLAHYNWNSVVLPVLFLFSVLCWFVSASPWQLFSSCLLVLCFYHPPHPFSGFTHASLFHLSSCRSSCATLQISRSAA